MPVSAEEVAHVARLAHIALTDEQTLATAADLNGILEHMDALRAVSTEGIDPTSGVGAMGTPLRADSGPSIGMKRPLDAIAPRVRDGLLIVPRLSSHR